MRFLYLVLLSLLLSCGQGENNKRNEVIFEGVKVKPIPGLTPAAVHDIFTKKGFKPGKTETDGIATWTSIENNENHEFKVITTATTTNEVISVQASVFSMLTMDESTKDFIGNVASLPYKNSVPQKAREWAIVNFEKGGNTSFGDVNFEVLVNSETSRTLKISMQ